MSSTSNYLAVTSGHIDSLINYVLDVKPYHAKLSAIVEQYIFHDDVNVKIVQDEQLLAFLGADISPKIGTPTIRARRSQSWWHDIMSDGNRTTWQVPLTSVNKFASHSSREVFYAGLDLQRRPGRVDDDTQIPGIGNISTNRVFSNIRWDGPGITDVKRYAYRIERDPLYTPNLPAISNPYDAPVHQQDTVDYFLSRGVFSFDVIQGGTCLQRYKERNIKNVGAFPEISGALYYADVVKPFAKVSNITGGNFEEWTITRVNNLIGQPNEESLLDNLGNEIPSNENWVKVSGSISGTIAYTHLPDLTFNHPSHISFSLDVSTDSSGTGIIEMMVGNKVVLTPQPKIVVSPTAPEETWSLIKTNPIALTSKPVFVAGSARPSGTALPDMEVHTDSLDYARDATLWQITFNGDGTYVLQATNSTGKLYGPSGLLVYLKDGCGYKDDNIQFTLIPSLDGYFAGDSFTFTVGNRVEHYLVYGSVSGWSTNAKIGEWYWNGKIGFKIPKLEYFAKNQNATIVTSPDALNGDWKITVANDQIIKSVEFTNGRFYITGSDSIVGTSTDGVTWTSDLSILLPNQQEYLITVGPGGTIGVGMQDTATYPIDPVTGYPANTADYIHVAIDQTTGLPYLPLRPAVVWQRAVSHVTENLNGFTQVSGALINPSGPNLSVTIAVGNGGVITSTVNGIGWATQDSNTTANLSDITFGNGLLVAVGEFGTILTSPDRINWTPRPSATSAHLTAVTYSAALGMFIAVGSQGTILRSVDGITWVNLSVFADGSFSDVIYADGKFVAVDNVDGWVASSVDGITWTRYRGRRMNSIAYGNGLFVCGGGTQYDFTNFIPLPLTSAYPAGVNATINQDEVDPAIHSSAEPSYYTVTFVSSTTATVSNNVYGQLEGLKVDTPWTDGRVCFKIPALSNGVPFQIGDAVKIYLAPKYKYTTVVGYDQSEYWIHGYDTDIGELTVPLIYNQEIFPLYHSHGSVIFKNVVDRDKFVIDKAANDTMRFRIEGASLLYPELAPGSDDWIPITLKYYDRVANNVPVSKAEFSDLATYIEGYLGSNPDQKVFHILQPRYDTSNRNASATIVLDSGFLSQYLKFGTNFSLLFLPDQSYGQKIRVKITENLRTYARVRMEFGDITTINISDAPINHFHIIEDAQFVDLVNVHFVEGGAIPIVGGYNFYPYNVGGYNDAASAVLTGVIETSPGVFTYTGNPADWIIPNPTVGPATQIEDERSDTVASASMVEGLTIYERERPINPDPTVGYDAYAYDAYPYDTDLDFVAAKFIVFYDWARMTTGLVIEQTANEYMVVMQNRTGSGTPTLVVEQLDSSLNGTGIFDHNATNTISFATYPAMPQLIDVNAFVFTTVFSAPFRLTLS